MGFPGTTFFHGNLLLISLGQETLALIGFPTHFPFQGTPKSTTQRPTNSDVSGGSLNANWGPLGSSTGCALRPKQLVGPFLPLKLYPLRGAKPLGVLGTTRGRHFLPLHWTTIRSSEAPSFWGQAVLRGTAPHGSFPKEHTTFAGAAAVRYICYL